MGPINSESQTKIGAINIDLVAGPQFASGFYLQSVLYNRITAAAIDIVLSAMWGDKELIIDQVTGTTATSYTFPNARVPHPIALPAGVKVRFKTLLLAAPGENHTAIIQYAQE